MHPPMIELGELSLVVSVEPDPTLISIEVTR